MKIRTAAISLFLSAVATTPGFAQVCPPVDVNASDANTRIVETFYDLAFNQRQPALAAECFLGEVYTQHNPNVADGPDAFVTAIGGLLAARPGLTVTFHRTVSEGALVVLHSHFQSGPDDLGSAVIDIFRLENGRIVEHWDVVQRIPEESANSNSMF